MERSSILIRFRFLREVLLVGIGYLIYSQVRGLAANRTLEAFENAYKIVDLEEKLGIFKELALQTLILPHNALIDVFNLIYFYGLFPLLVPTAVWLFVKRPAVYTILRNAFLSSGAIAVLFYLTLPTAPPRLLGGMGFVDTLSRSFTPSYESIPGVNHFAALPSMHVGWNLLTVVGIYLALKGVRVRWLILGFPVAMMTATVVTGNHYFIDGLLGLVVAMLGLSFAFWLDRRSPAQAILK
jgi:membrane-associated phospholipid phosphatase